MLPAREPGHGGDLNRPPVPLPQSPAQGLFHDLRTACEMPDQGLGPDETVATEPAKGIRPQWGDPTAFVTASFKSLWGHFAPDA